jgi:hypothetical protein
MIFKYIKKRRKKETILFRKESRGLLTKKLERKNIYCT